MAVVKLLNLLAISCLAVIASFGTTPVGALTVESHHARSQNHHAMLAKKKRATSSKRCKPRATTAAPHSSKTSSYVPKPTKTASSGSGGSSNGNSGSGGSSSGGGGGSGKAGIAWANGDSTAITNFKSWKVNKYYTWSPWCVDAANKAGMECCPMLWGTKQISDFTKLVKPGYAKCAMGPNEPNQDGQSDMSPSDAANLWQKYLQPLKKDGYYLVSPACTNAPSGKTWMQSFLGDCKGCDVDALGVHWYGTEYDDFIHYITDFHNTFGKDIWVTEFACQNFGYPISDSAHQCNIDKVFTFMQKVTAWMDSTSYVKAYFAFGALTDMGNVNPTNQLMTGGQTPNALGKLYIGV